jgi:endogenous inhibitor of DNA gyrase (YacG/DUF329 family)
MIQPKDTHTAKCPICGKPREANFRPFCSARCANIDLHRWLGEVYAVPDDETVPPDSADPILETDE